MTASRHVTLVDTEETSALNRTPALMLTSHAHRLDVVLLWKAFERTAVTWMGDIQRSGQKR